MGNSISVEAKTILLVDDEAYLADLFKKLLTWEGYHVVLASNGKQAVDIYTASLEHIDVVVMDICMPVMDGIAAYKALTLLDTNASILLMSGYSKESFDGLENIPFIKKPMLPAALFKTISELIESTQTVQVAVHSFVSKNLENILNPLSGEDVSRLLLTP